MAISIHRSLVEYLLLGPTGDRRQLQDSPILADVWIAFADKPEEPQEVLITPDWRQTAHGVAEDLDDRIHRYRGARNKRKPPNIAYLQKIIAARLYFDELLRVLVPVTCWWQVERNNQEMKTYLDATKGPARLEKVMTLLGGMASHWSAPTENKRVEGALSSFDRYAALAGLIMWARTASMSDDDRIPAERRLALAINGATNDIGAILRNLFCSFPKAAKKGKEKGRSAQRRRRIRPNAADLPGFAQSPGRSGHRSVCRLGQGRRGTRTLLDQMQRDRVGCGRFRHPGGSSCFQGRGRKVPGQAELRLQPLPDDRKLR